jgi:aldehyde dehydrogenase (NAD+)
MECFDAAGLPPGVINIVNGRGDVVGAEITRNPDIAKISFTGSTAVGKSIATGAVSTMKRVTLELGGKSPHILLDDADLEKAIPIALYACFVNSGQACIAGTRLIGPESRLEAVKKAIQAITTTMKVGNPGDADTVIGPLVTEKQYDRVQGFIKKGIEEGAELLLGGEGHPKGLDSGYFVKPTVFVNVTNNMTIAREEIFGPVLFYDEPSAPFGGFKQSGIGREYGVYGIEAYLEPKAVFGN